VLHVAILGTGNIASLCHGPALRNVRGARLWSVFSRDLERAESFAAAHHAGSPTPAYDDLAACLADPELHAVLITSPDGLHAAHAIAAARAGKHVFCEKPLATTLEEGRAMIAACKEAGVRLGVGYHLRWHAGHRALRDKIMRGDLGKVRHTRVQWTYRAESDSNWRASRALASAWALAAMGTHAIDLVRWFMEPGAGEITEVRSMTSRSVWKSPNDETALVQLRFKNGATADILASVLFDSPRRLEIYGSKANALCEATLGPYGEGRVTVAGEDLRWELTGPFEAELQDFVRAIAEERAPEVTGEAALENLGILLRAAHE
jgi:1,5-anhydro-D-fructose reductase (1,5-anhydro-D-mannitol-forming)